MTPLWVVFACLSAIADVKIELVGYALAILDAQPVSNGMLRQRRAELTGDDQRFSGELLTAMDQFNATPTVRLDALRSLAKQTVAYDSRYETRADVVQALIRLAKTADGWGVEPGAVSGDAIAASRALLDAAPENGRSQGLLAMAMEHATRYSLPQDPNEVLGLYRTCVMQKGPDYCRDGYMRVKEAYTSPRCARFPAGFVIAIGHEGKGARGLAHDGVDLVADATIATETDVQSAALTGGSKRYIDVRLGSAAAERMRRAKTAATPGGRIIVRLGNEVLMAPRNEEIDASAFGLTANDIDGLFAKLCPKPERRAVPAKLALPH